jgi:hypothetical protein
MATPETTAARRMSHCDHLPRYIVAVEVAEKLERERDEARMQLSAKCQTVTIAKGTIEDQRRRIEGLEMDNQIYSREREKSRATTARFAEAMTLLRREDKADAMVARLREILLHNK